MDKIQKSSSILESVSVYYIMFVSYYFLQVLKYINEHTYVSKGLCRL